MHKIPHLFIFVFIFLVGCQSVVFANDSASDKLDKLIDQTIKTSLSSLAKSVEEVKNYSLYPNYGTKDFKWQLQTSQDWTCGFYPGNLWYAYELSKDAKFKVWAEKWTAGIEKEKFNNKTHDLGFRFVCSFGNGLRLAPADTITRRYKELLLTAAATTDNRFSPLIGQYPSDWDTQDKKDEFPNSIPTIVDVMMNLELLLWASENGGDPKIKERCITHANTSFRDFVRTDGGTYHVVRYDNKTGKVVDKGQLQGNVDSSTWSRGQAWMVYGYTVMYRFTKDPIYLKNAMSLVDYFIAHLPADKVANWDFQSKLDHRDASASAIVCSALFEMQKHIKSEKKRQHYLSEAKAILTSLCRPPYFTEGKGTNCLLYHSTQYFHKTQNTDVPSSFADYYFMEALLRYKNMNLSKSL